MTLIDLKNKQAALHAAVVALESYPWMSLWEGGEEVERAIGILVRELDATELDIRYLQHADK